MAGKLSGTSSVKNATIAPSLSTESANTGRVFWSGGNKAMTAAADFATKNGQTTLEMTNAGQNLTKLTQGMSWTEAGPMWQRMSSTYAKGVPENTSIHVFHNAETGVGINSVWKTIEYPILKQKNVNIIYHNALP